MSTFRELHPLILSRAALEHDGAIAPGGRAPTAGFHRLRNGAYVAASTWKALKPEDRHRLEVLSALAAMEDDGGAVLSNDSAAVCWDLPLYRHSPTRVHVTGEGPHRGASSAVVLRHRMPLPPEDVVDRDGMRVTSLARTAFDIACGMPLEAALVCLDAAMRFAAVDGQTMDPDRAERWRDELRARARAAAGTRGVRQARTLIEFMDGRAQLPGESISRLQIHRLGFAPPRLQVPFPDSHGGWYWIDFGLDDVRRWGECDGKVKYLDPALRAGKTADEIVYDEKRREDWIRARSGWPMMRWGAEHYGTTRRFADRLAAYDVYPPARPFAERRPLVFS
ncbi:hypothetical protein [Microbacterium rhizophilus]|uniref:hypothetical protein n=1 Tax=Microbacterium rhizophilus TaxID=3138934 RepID=UPI0031F19373